MVQEIENIIDILQTAKKAIKENDVVTIRNVSDRTIHSSSITQDPDNINIAVILYALAKILERTRYQEMNGWARFEKTYENSIDNAITALKRKDIESYRSQIENIRDVLSKIEGHLKKYIEDIFEKAKITKASRIYEHGISRGLAAKILGVSIWELNEYVGKTGIADVNLAYTKDIKERIKTVEDIFK